MVRLYRKLKQKLFFDGKTEKYFKYAIGEIILIVIGILIALTINNRKELQNEQGQEILSYCELKRDVQLDKNRIITIIESLDKRQLICRQLLIKLHSTPKDKSTLIDDYLPAIRPNVFYPNKAALTDIISSGKLSLLRNKELKKMIINYYNNMENSLRIVYSNQEAVTDRIFQLDNFTEFGVHQHFIYKDEFGRELTDLLTSVSWHRDKNHPYFKKFENDIVAAILVNAREKQLLKGILDKAEPLLLSLNKACNIQ